MKNIILLFSISILASELSAQRYHYGIFSPTEQKIADVEYDNAKDFSENLCAVELEGKWGFIDTKGKVVIPFSYEEVSDFQNGMAKVRQNNFYGCIDKSGKFIIPAKYSQLNFNSDNSLAVAELQEKWGLINAKGLALSAFEYKSLEITEEFIFAEKSTNSWTSLWGYLGLDGKEIIKPQFQSVGYFKGKYASAQQNELWGVIDKSGKWTIPAEYEQQLDIADEFAIAYKNGHYGLISLTGKELAPFIYSTIGLQFALVSDGMIAVEKEGQWGFLNANTWQELPCEYEQVGRFEEGFAPVMKAGKSAFIDKNNHPICEFQYGTVDYFSEGLAAVSQGEKWGYIDVTGKLVIPLEYEAAHAFENKRAAVMKGDKWYSLTPQNQLLPEKPQDAVTDASYSLKEIDDKGTFSFLYPEWNLQVEKYWEEYGNAREGKITDLNTKQVLGEKVVFDHGKIVEGTFYHQNMSVVIKDKKGFKLEELRDIIAQEAAKLIAQNNNPITQSEEKELEALRLRENRRKELYELAEKERALFPEFLDLNTAFDLDASTDEEREINRIKRIKPYTDILFALIQKIESYQKDYYLDINPEFKAELDESLKTYKHIEKTHVQGK